MGAAYPTASLQEFVTIYAQCQQECKIFVGRSSYDARFCMTLPCCCVDDMSVHIDGIDNTQLIRLDVDPEVLKKYAEEHPTDVVGFMQLCVVTTSSFIDSFVNGSVLSFAPNVNIVHRIIEICQYDNAPMQVMRGNIHSAFVADEVILTR